MTDPAAGNLREKPGNEKNPANMIRFPEICCMFVVCTESFNYEVFITNKTETKKQGRHTGASPAVLSLPRNGLVHSDLPFLFYLKSFIMCTKNGQSRPFPGQQQPVTAEQIVREIIEHDNPEAIRETLREMMDTFFLYYSSESAEVITDAVFCTYKALDHALQQIEDYERLNSGRAVI